MLFGKLNARSYYNVLWIPFCRFPVHFLMSSAFIFYSMLFSWHQDSVDGVRLLSVSVSIFGPRKIVRELFITEDRDKELEPGYFMQVFEETFVPWCLHGYNHSTSSRLDLLLALLDDECFYEQWRAVISYAANVKHSGSVPGFPDFNHKVVLAMLLEKARDEITKRKVGGHLIHRQGSHPDHWHYELLESIAVSTVCSFPPFGTFDGQLMWYVNRKSRCENSNM